MNIVHMSIQCIVIPQLPSAPTLLSSANTIIASWSPTQFTPNSYSISSSCQLICGSSVTHQAVTVDGTLTTETIMTDFGSTCSVHVAAVFGSSIISNIVTSNSINTTSAGIGYTTYVCIDCDVNTLCLHHSPYWCSCRTHWHISGE